IIPRPPRSTQSRSSAASDVYKRQLYPVQEDQHGGLLLDGHLIFLIARLRIQVRVVSENYGSDSFSHDTPPASCDRGLPGKNRSRVSPRQVVRLCGAASARYPHSENRSGSGSPCSLPAQGPSLRQYALPRRERGIL